jgi:hypothetical protein
MYEATQTDIGSQFVRISPYAPWIDPLSKCSDTIYNIERNIRVTPMFAAYVLCVPDDFGGIGLHLCGKCDRI